MGPKSVFQIAKKRENAQIRAHTHTQRTVPGSRACLSACPLQGKRETARDQGDR